MLASLVALALLAVHLALLTSERHGPATGPVHGCVEPAALASHAVRSAVPHGADEEPGRHSRHTVLGGCPAQQAILPLLSAALALLGAFLALRGRRHGSAGPAGPSARLRAFPPAVPPPLQSARRRALLQVFLN
jgi:hypothetical protein